MGCLQSNQQAPRPWPVARLTCHIPPMRPGPGQTRPRRLQNAATAPAAAPVETVRAIAQSQASARSRMKTEPPAGNQAVRKSAQQTLSQKAAPPGAKKPNLSLTKPMTAVLLHELRLQRELADVQEEVKQKRA